jgi:hypothetical protein
MHIRDLEYLEIRAKLGEELLKQGVFVYNNNQLGWWKDDLTFVSFYDVMEAIRDQR